MSGAIEADYTGKIKLLCHSLSRVISIAPGSRNTGLGSESSDQDSGKSRGTDHSQVQQNRDGESCLPSLNFPKPIPIHHNAQVFPSFLLYHPPTQPQLSPHCWDAC
ncbi:hypothetical protein LEMLEM_LOCUS1099 [Lemmus lemmus]